MKNSYTITEKSPENNNLLNSTINKSNKNNLDEINSKAPNERRIIPKFNICINSIMKEDQQHIEEIIYFRNQINIESNKNNKNNKNIFITKEDKTIPLDYIEKKRDQNYLKDKEIFEDQKEDKIKHKFNQDEKNKIKFYINVEMIRKEKEMEIQKRIESINAPNLTEFEKRAKIVLEKCTEYYKIKDDNFGEKKEEICFYKNKENESNNINNVSVNLVDSKINNNKYENNKSLSLNDSSLDKSKIDESNFDEQSEKRFNTTKNEFYIKNNLYDLCLIKEPPKNLLPDIYKINEKYKGFLYPNDLKTYCITQSGFLLQKEKKENYSVSNVGNTDLGLFFCGKKIIIKNNEEKKCSLNQFICLECMKYNKERYNIKDNYLININGRVSKINKGKYHCFGHFLNGDLIEDCINKFICRACKLLQIYSEYYTPKTNLRS